MCYLWVPNILHGKAQPFLVDVCSYPEIRENIMSQNVWTELKKTLLRSPVVANSPSDISDRVYQENLKAISFLLVPIWSGSILVKQTRIGLIK